MDIQHHVTCLTRVRHRHRFVICAQSLRRTRARRLINRKHLPNSLFERLGPRATNDHHHSILDASEMQTHNLAYSLPCCSLRGACTGCCEPTERVGASNTASRPLHHIYIYIAHDMRDDTSTWRTHVASSTVRLPQEAPAGSTSTPCRAPRAHDVCGTADCHRKFCNMQMSSSPDMHLAS